MANHKSSEKRVRQDIKKNLRNRSYLSKVKTSIRKFKEGVSQLVEGKTTHDDVAKLFVGAQSLLQKASCRGLLHPNNTSRRIKRLAASFRTIAKS